MSSITVGLYPQQVIEETNEDLNTFVDFLQNLDIEVVRPTVNKHVEYYNYCPRDLIFTYGNKKLATPMTLKERQHEWKNYLDIIPDLIVPEKIFYNNENYNEACVGNPDILALTEQQPMFDAANIIKANDDILYLVSNTGNKAGATWLQSWLKDHGYPVKVHLLENVYSYIHIDLSLIHI